MKERKKQRFTGRTGGREKARCVYTAWIKEPWFKKKNEWIQGCAMDWYILRDVQRFILMRTVEVKKTTNQDTSLTIWQTRSCRSKRRIGSRTGVFCLFLFFLSGKKSLLLQHSLCALRRIIAELLYVLCSNHYDGSNVLRYYCVESNFPAALSLSLSDTFRDA